MFFRTHVNKTLEAKSSLYTRNEGYIEPALNLLAAEVWFKVGNTCWFEVQVEQSSQPSANILPKLGMAIHFNNYPDIRSGYKFFRTHNYLMRFNDNCIQAICYCYFSPFEVEEDLPASFERNLYQKEECEFQTILLFRCSLDHSDKSLMSTLWCEICCKYERRIEGKKNFSRAWIDGSTYHKTSNATDHVSSKQHKAAMTLRKRRILVSLLYTSYSTIACCLHNPPWILLDLN